MPYVSAPSDIARDRATSASTRWPPRPGRSVGSVTSRCGSRPATVPCRPAVHRRRRAAGDLRRRPRRRRARRFGVPARDHAARWCAPSSPAGPASTPSPLPTASTCGCSTRVDDDLDGMPADVRRTRCDGAPAPSTSRTRSPSRRPSRALEVGAPRSPSRRSPPVPSCCSAATWASATPPPLQRWSPPGSGCRRARSSVAAPVSTTPRWPTRRPSIDRRCARAGDRTADPVDSLTALGSADLAATTGYLLAAAAGRRAGAARRFDVGRLRPHRRADRARRHRLVRRRPPLHRARSGARPGKIGLEPLLDLGLRLGEGSGAVAAVPIVRSAAALLRDVALLAEL